MAAGASSKELGKLAEAFTKGEREPVINIDLEEMRRLADRILDDTGRLDSRNTDEACRRFAAGKTTGDETRVLVRELLRSAAERES
jgi:hypothetical protein